MAGIRADAPGCREDQRGTCGAAGGYVNSRLAGLAVVLSMLLPSPSAVAEHLVMPFACKVERGRVVLTPSPPRSYPIQGTRAQRPFTWCAPGDGPCRIRMVHRFELNCGGVRMSWLAVAAAAARARTQTLSIAGGRLRMALTATGDLADACDLRTGTDRDCRARPSGRPGIVIASLPPGFAPLHEVGARLAQQPLPPPRPAEATTGHPPERMLPAGDLDAAERRAVAAGMAGARLTEPVSAAPARQDGIAAVLARDGRSSDGREALPARTAGEGAPPVSSTGWTASVIDHAQAAAGEAPGVESRTRTGPIILALLLGSVVAGAGFQYRRRVVLSSGAFARRTGAYGIVRKATGALLNDQDERACVDLGRTVEQLMRNADARLDELTAAAPLRGVLRQELDLIKLRLAEGLQLADQPKPKWRQLRTRLQGAIRELHRIVKIAEGAIASFAANGASRDLPRSREEAYEALGVNADVSENVLKKVVDALRMSWHPDLAKDEPDRLRREERTKIINVAWDLVTGRRVEMS